MLYEVITKNSLPGNTGFLQKLSYQADPNFDVVRILFRSDPNYSGADQLFAFVILYGFSIFTGTQLLPALNFYRHPIFTGTQLLLVLSL